ncbi:MAG TPA: hypothetical protein VH834_25530 [Solirubrobacteraceae bacterium]|jgi:hypothetical protein
MKCLVSMAVVLAVAVGGVASPTIAAAHVGTTPAGGDAPQAGDGVTVARRPAAKVRGRFQLKLADASRLIVK